ncbi:futalosine hydrolase [Streptomyces bikiniensis]|uniref:futalosine hydrolase n=1 Tax=Streptomyces bikiniensis TaxID=1896 RepID=UPI0004BF6EBA|nr:futalosine hydrolase [Streptomyces bikiniensis]
MVHRILIVTAVAAEADSVSAGLASVTPEARDVPAAPERVPLPGGHALRRHAAEGDRARVDVLVGGVGPAAAAAATGTALAHAALTDADRRERPYDLVVSAGIGGGFRPAAPLGSLVVSSAIVAADLGAETPDGYLAVDALGFGRSAHPVPEALTGRVAAALAAEGLPCAVAPVLTVSTVTGTARRAAELAERHPGAAAEAMEGFGVAEAAAPYGVPVVELRAVSNAVGPRDRAAWRIGDALDALRRAAGALSRTVPEEAPWN